MLLKSNSINARCTKGSESSTGIYVHGGGPDQNLIILDEAPCIQRQPFVWFLFNI